RWIGSSIVEPAERAPHRVVAIRAFLVGSGILVVLYMIPLVGFVVWATTSTFAIGASVLAFLAAYRKENPAPVRAARATVAGGAAAIPFPEAATMSTPESAVPASGDVGPPVSSETALMPRAPFRDRLAAGVLDLILVI